MRRTSLALFVFFLAAGACPLDQCSGDCALQDHSRDGGILPSGATTSQVTECGTCDHAAATGTWGAQPGAAGSMTLTLQGSCSGKSTQVYTSTAAPSSGTVSISNVPSSDLCGTANVTWTAILRNDSNVPVGTSAVNVNCPNVPATGVSPTRVGVR